MSTVLVKSSRLYHLNIIMRQERAAVCCCNCGCMSHARNSQSILLREKYDNCGHQQRHWNERSGCMHVLCSLMIIVNVPCILTAWCNKIYNSRTKRVNITKPFKELLCTNRLDFDGLWLVGVWVCVVNVTLEQWSDYVIMESVKTILAVFHYLVLCLCVHMAPSLGR